MAPNSRQLQFQKSIKNRNRSKAQNNSMSIYINHVLITIAAVIITFITQCNQPPSESQTLILDSTNTPPVVEVTPKRKPINKTKPKPIPAGLDTTGLYTVANSAQLRIAKLHRFYSTRENDYYLNLSLQSESLWQSLDSLRALSDSIIFEDDEIRRTFIPLDIAETFVDLTKSDTFQLFTMDHRPVGTGHLHHIEYYEDLIESQFVAILKINDQAKDENLYGICGAPYFLKDFAVIETFDEATVNSVNVIAGDSLTTSWAKDDVILKPDGDIFGFRSFRNEGHEKSVLIKTEQETGVISKLLEISNDYSILEIIPMPFTILDEPVFLLFLGVPETDIRWYGVASITENGYEIGGTLVKISMPVGTE